MYFDRSIQYTPKKPQKCKNKGEEIVKFIVIIIIISTQPIVE